MPQNVRTLLRCDRSYCTSILPWRAIKNSHLIIIKLTVEIVTRNLHLRPKAIAWPQVFATKVKIFWLLYILIFFMATGDAIVGE